MGQTEPKQVTQILGELVAGDDSAASRLLPLVYEELRALAGHIMKGERPDHTLQPTALVHEAYVRLVGTGETKWKGRAHFLAVASRAMRRLLINHARDRRAAKRGGGEWARVTLDEAVAVAEERVVDIIALDEALERLGTLNERQARLVELRFFGGLSLEEAAEVMEVGRTTAKGDWTIARTWLARELGKTKTHGL
ncbi:MAG: sigma-70 family RNA polymerase sigma factor [Phycisphaerales bacterium]|nr:sigma-70 family RNA polymerase sigma factor [Phycisphaerales bacterium]